jgi:hypothetical protein
MRRANVRLTLTATLLTLGAAMSAASAQPGTVAPVRQAPLEIETTIDDSAGIDDDAIADRAWLSPTAFTQPAGALAVTYYQPPGPVAVMSATYGLTDQLHVTGLAGMVWDDGGSDDNLYMLHGKYQLLSSGRFRAAVQGGAMFVDDTTIPNVGLIGSLCFDDACGSILSGYVGHAWEHEDDDDRVMVMNASLIAKVSAHFKLVMEIDTFTVAQENDSGVLGFYGFRLTSGKWAGDLGLARPIGEGDEDGWGPGLPMISLTYRAR